MMHTQNRAEWDRVVKAMGCEVEPDGSGMDAAHIDGKNHGYWDPKYAGVGMGVIFEKV
jgi:hypothetical protein